MRNLLPGKLGLCVSGAALILLAPMLSAAAAPSAYSNDVVISKTWLESQPIAAGGTATARLTATNAAPSPQLVTIRDTYDVGLTPPAPASLPAGCTAQPAPARVIECTATVGAAPGVIQFDIPYTVTYQGPKRYTRNWKSEERITVMKADQHWNLYGGEVKTFDLECPAGYFMIDQWLHKDPVDQNQGVLEDVHVKSTNMTTSKWTVVIDNDSGGQAQGHLWATCAKDKTNHANAVNLSGMKSQPLTRSFVGDVPTEFHATCDPGETPIAINLKATQAGYWQDELYTQTGLFANGGPSAVFFALVHDTGSFELQWRCMATAVAGSGYRMDLRVASDTNTVPANTEKDFTTTCADDEKGIIGGWRGLTNGQKFHTFMNGQEPRPKLRTYWMRNLTASPLTYDTRLLCLGNRLVRGGKIDKAVTDSRCNYADGWIDGATDYWLNWVEVCVTVKQG